MTLPVGRLSEFSFLGQQATKSMRSLRMVRIVRLASGAPIRSVGGEEKPGLGKPGFLGVFGMFFVYCLGFLWILGLFLNFNNVYKDFCNSLGLWRSGSHRFAAFFVFSLSKGFLKHLDPVVFFVQRICNQTGSFLGWLMTLLNYCSVL